MCAQREVGAPANDHFRANRRCAECDGLVLAGAVVFVFFSATASAALQVLLSGVNQNK